MDVPVPWRSHQEPAELSWLAPILGCSLCEAHAQEVPVGSAGGRTSMTPISGSQVLRIHHVNLLVRPAFGHFTFLGYVDLNHLSHPRQK